MNFLLNITKIIIFLSPISFIISPLFVNLIVITLSAITLVLIFFRKSFNLFLKKECVFFILFCFFGFIFHFYENIESAIRSLLYLRFLFIYILIVYLIDFKKSELKYFFYFLFFILIIIDFDLIYQFIFRENILGFPVQKDNRMSSFFGKELIAGSYLLIFSLFLFYLIITKSTKKHYLVFNIIALTIFLGIFLSFERMAIIKFIFVYFYFNILILYEIKKYNFKKIFFYQILVCIILISTIFIIIFNNNQYKERFNKTFNDPINIENVYANLIVTGVDVFISQPIKGVGMKNYYKTCIKHKKYNLSYLAKYWERTIEHLANVKGFSLEKLNKRKKIDPEIQYIKVNDKYLLKELIPSNFCSSHTHNYLISILVETGIIGLVLIFFSIYIIVINSFKNKYFFSIEQHFLIVFLFIMLFPLQISGNILQSFYGSLFWFNLILFVKMNKIS